jgi:hypothetical protein
VLGLEVIVVVGTMENFIKKTDVVSSFTTLFQLPEES